MANEEQLAILRQGVGAWNKWRNKNSEVIIDLREADLNEARLIRINLRDTDLSRADLRWSDISDADLSKVNLSGAKLMGANLRGSNLSKARLEGASLSAANLLKANLMETDFRSAEVKKVDLREADLREADLRGADFTKANLRRAKLSRAILSKAILYGADLSASDLLESKLADAEVGRTIFGDLDLSSAIGLDGVIHAFPSRISTDTFIASKGKISEVFLRGCGLSDWEIEEVKLYNPDLSNDEINKILYRIYDFRATQAIQISPLFISYGHANNAFVDKLEVYLNKKGVRFWRDVHDMKAGRIEKQIDRAIRQNPTILLVLSESSLSSDWVEHEVRKGRELEKEIGRDVLCPIALDDSWTSSRWPKRVMEQIMEYNILDFSAWNDDDKFADMFHKLIDGLELFYKG